MGPYLLGILAAWTINVCVRETACSYSFACFQALTFPGKEKGLYLYICIHIQYMHVQ